MLKAKTFYAAIDFNTFKVQFCFENCFLSSVATEDKDERRLKIEKVDLTFVKC